MAIKLFILKDDNKDSDIDWDQILNNLEEPVVLEAWQSDKILVQ